MFPQVLTQPVTSSQEELADLSAGLQHLVTKHLAERLQRACEFLAMEEVLHSDGHHSSAGAAGRPGGVGRRGE
jgi:hypothetical protein